VVSPDARDVTVVVKRSREKEKDRERWTSATIASIRDKGLPTAMLELLWIRGVTGVV
jgi:hypothetical protein